MSKYQLIDMLIILFGVSMAWVCAWKSKFSFDMEEYERGVVYAVLVIVLLVIVFAEVFLVAPDH